MTRYSETDRIVAMAGIFQGARLARDIARTGICDAGAFEASRESLFEFSPESVEAVFGGRQGVERGLRALCGQLDRPEQRDLEIARYVIAILNLADRLRKSADHMQLLYGELSALGDRRSQFELGESVQHEQLSKIYQDRVSILGSRIMVKGEPLHLQNPDNAARIRVVLLAGIRAAVLWRQAGGKKWHLLLRRRAIAATARDLVDSLTD